MPGTWAETVLWEKDRLCPRRCSGTFGGWPWGGGGGDLKIAGGRGGGGGVTWTPAEGDGGGGGWRNGVPCRPLGFV